jgi:CRP-like cAMP-binding protein
MSMIMQPTSIPSSPSAPDRKRVGNKSSSQMGRGISYRETTSPTSIEETAPKSFRGKDRRGSGHFAGETIDRKDLSPAEETNLVRLFNTFSTEVTNSESDEPYSVQTQSHRVIDFPDLHALLKCQGLKIDDDLFKEMTAELTPISPDELTFEEFVTFMVRCQRLRELREELEVTERGHVDNFSKERFMSDSTWRWWWDAAILVITSYYMITVSYEWVVLTPMTLVSWIIEGVFAFVYIADILVYANTVTKDSAGQPVDNLKQCVLVYLKRTFVFDLLGSLPIDLILSWAYIDTHHTLLAFRIFRALRLLRIVRATNTLFAGVSIHGFLRPQFVYLNYTIAPVLKALFYFIMVVHYLSIGWMVVVTYTCDDYPSYIDALYIVLYTLSTCGYGDMRVLPGAQRLYCCFLFLGGVIMNGLVISQMSVFIQKADIQNDRKDKMRETLAVLRHFDIPETTQSEILSFQNHLLSHNLGSSHEELMGSLPTTIQESLGLFMRIKFIAMVPMFASSPQDCKEALATTLVNIVFHPHEFIIVAGEIGGEMYFLGHGAADVIGPTGMHFVTLRKGGFFGEIALLVDGARRNASIKALTYCDTFRLEKNDFNRIMHKFPHFRRILENEVAERVAQFKATQKPATDKVKRRRKRSSTTFVRRVGSGDLSAGSTTEPAEFDTSETLGRPHADFGSIRMEKSVIKRFTGAGGPVPFIFSAAPPDSPRFNTRHRVGFNEIAAGRREEGALGGLARRGSLRLSQSTHYPPTPHLQPGLSERDVIAELAERVALLERRQSTGGGTTPLLPAVYSTLMLHDPPPILPAIQPAQQPARNVGKSKDVPGFLAEVVSSDDGAESPANRSTCDAHR